MSTVTLPPAHSMPRVWTEQCFDTHQPFLSPNNTWNDHCLWIQRGIARCSPTYLLLKTNIIWSIQVLKQNIEPSLIVVSFYLVHGYETMAPPTPIWSTPAPILQKRPQKPNEAMDDCKLTGFSIQSTSLDSKGFGHTMEIGCLWPQVGWVLLSQLHMLYHSYFLPPKTHHPLNSVVKGTKGRFQRVCNDFAAIWRLLFFYSDWGSRSLQKLHGASCFMFCLNMASFILIRVIGALLP